MVLRLRGSVSFIVCGWTQVMRKIMRSCDVADYIIRELKMWRTCGGGIRDREREERSIVQYHYLVWKDFMAPEHPAGILKFIRRMNEAYSLEKGPILVHCRYENKVF
jgi:protein tyrosine phosphatase